MKPIDNEEEKFRLMLQGFAKQIILVRNENKLLYFNAYKYQKLLNLDYNEFSEYVKKETLRDPLSVIDKHKRASCFCAAIFCNPYIKCDTVKNKIALSLFSAIEYLRIHMVIEYCHKNNLMNRYPEIVSVFKFTFPLMSNPNCNVDENSFATMLVRRFNHRLNCKYADCVKHDIRICYNSIVDLSFDFYYLELVNSERLEEMAKSIII